MINNTPRFTTEEEYQNEMIKVLNADPLAKKHLERIKSVAKELDKEDSKRADIFFKESKGKLIELSIMFNKELRSLFAEMMYFLLREEIKPLEK